MPTKSKPKSRARLITELGQLANDRARKKYAQRHRQLLDVGLVEALSEDVVKQARSDPDQALQLAQAALIIASQLKDQQCLLGAGVSARKRGGVVGTH